ncbi:MAG: hypothetical protein HKN48_03275 [Flavobacteriaceae bacterium]|nr:hypothetical protein [Flavobacteriaceae bacterium]
MNKALILPLILLFVGVFSSCRNDDGNPAFIEARERSEEAPNSTATIEEYLQTHFYNYEEFDNPSPDFDFKIKFDTISGDNADKIPLSEQVSFKMVNDRVDPDVTYKLYYLSVIEGEGDQPNFPDLTTVTYEGTWLNTEITSVAYTELFDSSVVPVTFDLTAVVNGFQDAMIEFKGATKIISNPDGTVDFEDYGVGAVFIPSGLGYYVTTPNGSSIPIYANLIFSFQLYEINEGDQDNDGILSINEDLNGNMQEEDDDTDSDGLPNFFDADDDNDGRPTSEEIEIDADGNITFPDEDNDGIVDYLDEDS